MNKKLIIWGVVALIAIWAITGINTIPRLDESVKASWSQVENQYQRRMDLIPNLVESVKGYASHEKTVFEDVTNARAMAMQATGPAKAAAGTRRRRRWMGGRSAIQG